MNNDKSNRWTALKRRYIEPFPSGKAILQNKEAECLIKRSLVGWDKLVWGRQIISQWRKNESRSRRWRRGFVEYFYDENEDDIDDNDNMLNWSHQQLEACSQSRRRQQQQQLQLLHSKEPDWIETLASQDSCALPSAAGDLSLYYKVEITRVA